MQTWDVSDTRLSPRYEVLFFRINSCDSPATVFCLAFFTRKLSPMPRTFLMLGAINAFLCVALGAFGAHGLKQRLSTDMLAVYQTGVQYHFYHALGLLAVGLILLHFPKSRLIVFSGWSMVAGIILFSVSLYALSLTGVRGLGAITPLGGVAFLSAWAMLAYGVWSAK